MRGAQADRNLLLGVLALRTELADRDTVVAGLGAAARAAEGSLGFVLVERGTIDPADRAVLEAMADRLAARHGDDLKECLRSLGAAAPYRSEGELATEDELATLVGEAADATTDHRLGGNGHAAGRAGDGRPSIGSGRFRVIRLHDRGGLGEVFVARDHESAAWSPSSRCVPSTPTTPTAAPASSWRRRSPGAWSTPASCRCTASAITATAGPFYAMRFIRGDSLKEAIRRFHAAGHAPGPRSLALRKLLGRFLDVCDAIAYAHSRGVLHRDLKPGNVMLGPFGETLVVDWGLAKTQATPPSTEATVDDGEGDSDGSLVADASSEVEKTEAGSRVGTPGYMPPEQAAGRLDELGPESDVYSLGATLYALLTGRAPFSGPDVLVLLNQIERGDFPAPRAVRPWIDPALEAICLKAMKVRPRDRYPTPRALAEDVQKWMADEPVSAYPEPWPKRLKRWARNHRTLVAASAAAAAVALAARGYAFYEGRLREGQKLTAAHGRLDAMATAEVRALPMIGAQLGADRGLVNDRLIAMADGPDDRLKLPAALVLFQDDAKRSDFLVDRVLKPEATPDEVMVIRDALAARGGGDALAATFRGELAGAPAELSDRQLRAAGVLAKLAPGDPSWAALGRPLAEKLATENPLRLAAWRETFQPVSATLIGPLRAVYADRSRPEARDRAVTLLAEFAVQPGNRTRAEDLAGLLPDAEPQAARKIVALLADPADRARAIAALTPRLNPPARIDPEGAARQGRVASALALLGEVGTVWPILKATDEPSVRTELIHDLARYGVGERLVTDRLGAEPDVSARRALVLALGEYPPAALPEADRRALGDRLLALYRTDRDPGLHSAIDWLLRRRWERADAVDAIDRAVAAPNVPADRDWYVNGQGLTFAVVRGPVEFRMGSTAETDPKRLPNEGRHLRRIGRTFAISTREVTSSQYAKFLDEKPPGVEDVRLDPQYQKFDAGPEGAVGGIIWYEAARFCNWLSEKEGLPRDQWCYPDAVGPGMALPANFLERTGYRLPTEAEWEYSCRAGSIATRFHGQGDAWTGEYAWHAGNGTETMHPVGRKKPNDLGLFDTLGNAFEFCNDPLADYPAAPDGRVVEDALIVGEFSEKTRRLLRGGAFFFTPTLLRSAWRVGEQPSSRDTVVSFRPARTCP